MNQTEKLDPMDLELERFVSLTALIKQYTKELDTIKDDLKARGTFSTTTYVCVVETCSRELMPAKAKLLELHPTLADQIRTIEYQKVKVAKAVAS